MMAEKKSKIFGTIRDPEPDEKSKIEMLVETCPIAVFQVLNKRLNARGFCIYVTVIDEDL
jgi:hypothetical protein